MRFVLLFSALCAFASAGCPAKISCTQGVDSDGYSNYKVVSWDANSQMFHWTQVVEPNHNSDLCVISYNQYCEIQMFGSLKSSFPDRDSGCKYHENEKMVFCVCRDSHYCNMAPSHYAASAKAAFIGGGMDISHNCPNAWTPPDVFIPPTACAGAVAQPPPQPEPQQPVQNTNTNQQSSPNCPAKIKCTQGVDSDGYSNFKVVSWDATSQMFHWTQVVQSSDNSDVCVIGFNQYCEIQMFGAEKSSFPDRDTGCLFHDKEKMVFCVCRDSHYCNMAPSHYAPYAKQAFVDKGISIDNNCPASWTPPDVFIPPTQCEEAQPVKQEQKKKPDSAGQLNVLMAVSGALIAGTDIV